jgi:hypothetical protein
MTAFTLLQEQCSVMNYDDVKPVRNRILRDLPLKIYLHCNGLKKLKPQQVSGLHDGFCNLA